MMRTNGLDMSPTITDAIITDFIVDAAWAICSTYHTVLKSIPGAASLAGTYYLTFPTYQTGMTLDVVDKRK